MKPKLYTGYLRGIWLATALEKLFQVWSSKVSHPRRAEPNGTGKQSTSCFPMKNTLAGCCFKKQSAPAFLKLKTMASWIGISIPAPMRPLFLMRCSWQCNRRKCNGVTAKSNRMYCKCCFKHLMYSSATVLYAPPLEFRRNMWYYLDKICMCYPKSHDKNFGGSIGL